MEWLGDGGGRALLSPRPETGPPPGDPAPRPGPPAPPPGAPAPPHLSQPAAAAAMVASSADSGGGGSLASLCQRQQRCVKASMGLGWRLAEAQHQLCSMELHGSESQEQERARASACPSELSLTEAEWRRKEGMLGGAGCAPCDASHSPVLGAVASWDVFDKSIINAPQMSSSDCNQDRSKNFIQKYETELRHFGMLRRWDDSQRFLSEQPALICEETANHLILWCFRLQQEGKEALMEQVAHQAVVMQFILEMGASSQQDPRGCFRLFFHKAKAGQEGYRDVFHTELEAFKRRVREYTALRSRGDTATATATLDGGYPGGGAARLDPRDVLESLPPELKAAFQLQDMQILQNVLSTMNPQVAEYHVKRCLEAGLWSCSGRWEPKEDPREDSKEDSKEADDVRMMEMS